MMIDPPMQFARGTREPGVARPSLADEARLRGGSLVSRAPLRELETLEVQRRPARVYVGGPPGAPVLLLLHGGWAGAATHWSRVPGLGALDQPALGSLAEYTTWLVALCDTLAIERCHVVGNSFGGSLAWSLAGRNPERCVSLVLVDGIPLPKTPRLLQRLGQTPLGAALMCAIVRRVSYDPSALAKAFVDVHQAPHELRSMLDHHGDRLVPRFAALLVAGDGGPAPRVRPHLLWGAGDRLPGTSAAAARKLHASLPGATLQLIPGAGHFPQLEAPDVFVAELQAVLG